MRWVILLAILCFCVVGLVVGLVLSGLLHVLLLVAAVAMVWILVRTLQRRRPA